MRRSWRPVWPSFVVAIHEGKQKEEGEERERGRRENN
jgi:hypothetical protein